MRILIVDDSRIMQAGMKRALVNAGHDVTVAGRSLPEEWVCLIRLVAEAMTRRLAPRSLLT